MIVVKIELHSAVTGRTVEIGRAVITNDGTGTPSFTSTTRKSKVPNYNRLDRPVWDLVAKMLTNLGYGK